MKTDLIHFGAHTVTHEILTNLSLEKACKQIIDSKSIIQEKLGCTINLFAYPNGMEDDYNNEHISCLKQNGFFASVTTAQKLNRVHEDPYRLGRMCVGPGFPENPNHFALNTSGFISALKSLAKPNHLFHKNIY